LRQRDCPMAGAQYDGRENGIVRSRPQPAVRQSGTNNLGIQVRVSRLPIHYCPARIQMVPREPCIQERRLYGRGQKFFRFVASIRMAACRRAEMMSLFAAARHGGCVHSTNSTPTSSSMWKKLISLTEYLRLVVFLDS